jgi:tetratricopeptide (TPR) repeat protein
MVKPLCFMIMPYGRKATQAAAGTGPAEIDFNALWDRGYVPVITALGYEPVRADQDTGALIISQMLERLYFADLVLADMTIPNGNVYYEVGIRHAAKERGCVLLAADWSRQLFDVVQMRTIRYPLPEGSIIESTAQAFQGAIKDTITVLARGISPMHQSLPGYPSDVDESNASSMRGQMTELAAFQTKVRAVRAAPRAARMELAQKLIASDGSPPATYAVTLAILLLLRGIADKPADWNVILDFVGRRPPEFADQPEVLEHRAFAIAQAGDNVQAIAEIGTLIDTLGPTPERLGIMGGRYKRLMLAATSDEERKENLAKAIDCYERGMDLDLNEYYCSSNLPRLYRQRANPGDEERAQTALKLVIAACERAKRLNLSDPWLRATLLNAAFDSGDADKAEELLPLVAAEGAARWQLTSILDDLEASVAHVGDGTRKARLAAVIAGLKTV